MKQDFVIYGAGGHASVVADLVEALNGNVCTFFDDHNATVYQHTLHAAAPMIIGIGNNSARETIADKVTHGFVSLVHPDASVAENVRIGDGTVVLAKAVVQANTVLGSHVIINAGAVVDHDVTIEDFVHIAPNAYIGGGAYIEKGVVIGPGVVVSRFARVKANTMVPPLTVV